MADKHCYHLPPAGLDPSRLGGLLIVLEGPDSAGRSTQVRLLRQWLEQRGHAVAEVGLSRSFLVGPELERAKQGNVLSPRTMSLFYACDFYDQLENVIVPALRAGSVVLADRYIFTLMARDVVRGSEPEWVESLYSMALVPDAVYFLSVTPQQLVRRSLRSHGSLDYWEAGMGLGLSRDWYTSFMLYQRRLRAEYRRLQQRYQFEVINANRAISSIHHDLQTRIDGVLSRPDLS